MYLISLGWASWIWWGGYVIYIRKNVHDSRETVKNGDLHSLNFSACSLLKQLTVATAFAVKVQLSANGTIFCCSEKYIKFPLARSGRFSRGKNSYALIRHICPDYFFTARVPFFIFLCSWICLVFADVCFAILSRLWSKVIIRKCPPFCDFNVRLLKVWDWLQTATRQVQTQQVFHWIVIVKVSLR